MYLPPIPPPPPPTAVLDGTEKAVLPDRQDLSDPDQGAHQPPPGGSDPRHAGLQEGGARHGGGEALPQPRAQP